MAEYIEREKAIEAAVEGADYWDGGSSPYRRDCITDEINAIPAADVVPAKRGKWLRTNCSPHRIYCSECYSTFIWDDEATRLKDVPHNYCPKCGADMRGDQE